MEKQQTAVQHLMQWLSYYNPEAHAELIVKGHYQDALEMEREQMERSFAAGWEDGVTLGHHQEPKYQTGFNYFTDTYQTEP